MQLNKYIENTYSSLANTSSVGFKPLFAAVRGCIRILLMIFHKILADAGRISVGNRQ